MSCAALAAAVYPGAFVGPDDNGDGNALLPSQVIVCTEDCAIGKVTRHAASGDTSLTFELLPTLTTGSSLKDSVPGYAIQGAPTAKTTSATLTAAELLTGIITAAQGASGAATYTLPTGTLMDAALPANFPVNGSFEFSLVNISTTGGETATLAAGTGFTIVGNAGTTIATAQTRSSVRIRCRKTAANTFVAYVVG